MIKIKTSLYAAAFLLILAGCSENNSGPSAPPPRPVRTSAVITSDVPVYVENFGTLSSDLSINIQSQVTGEILTCNFTEGQYVKKGDTLFEIDSQVYEANLNQAKAMMSQDKADMRLAELIVTKDKPLADKGAIASQDFATYLANFEKLIAKVEVDKAVIQQNQISVDFCKIVSPIDGITGERLVDPGNIVTANSGPVLVNIRSIDSLNVDFTISERYIFLLRESFKKNSLKAIVCADGFGAGNTLISRQYTGELQLIDNTINPATGTIGLRAVVSNKERELWPGQFVIVKLIFFNKPDALLVPTQAINLGLKGEFIIVVRENKAEVLWVKTGLKQGEYTVIEKIIGEGKLEPGEQVVTVGQMGLIPNAAVEIIGKDEFKISDNDPVSTHDSADTARNNTK